MKFHVKFVAVIYISIGFVVAAFILLVLFAGALTSLGLIKSATNHGGFGSAFGIFMILVYPTLWLLQTGFGLWNYEKNARMWGVLIAAILLIGLNSALLLAQDRTSATGKGWPFFYIVLIAAGGIRLRCSCPKEEENYFRNKWPAA